MQQPYFSTISLDNFSPLDSLNENLVVNLPVFLQRLQLTIGNCDCHRNVNEKKSVKTIKFRS